jgi:UDP-glucose 4-epimerase
VVDEVAAGRNRGSSLRILLTGASSFTGAWFARTLADRGHNVVATLRRPIDHYEGLANTRLLSLTAATILPECPFGTAEFMRAINAQGPFDAVCLHAARTEGYKSFQFDALAALSSNVQNIAAVFDLLRGQGKSVVVLTGSVFEAGEGAGTEPRRAFSPYGLSKTLTAQTVRFYADATGLRLGKFVISNPFGPMEEARFTHYLLSSWSQGRIAKVNTPAYVRDNIHVSLLARCYSDYVEQLVLGRASAALHPCGYVETQGAFAYRFAAAIRSRLPLPCELALTEQREFPEPIVRINTDLPDTAALGWSEREAWDDLARYYANRYGIG